MNRRASSVVAASGAAVAGIMLAAWGSGSGSTADDPASGERPTAETSTTSPRPEHAEVRLLDHGSGKKVLLRLDPEVGQVLVTTEVMTTSSTAPGYPTAEMRLRLVMETRVDEVTDTEISLSTRYLDVSLEMPGAGSETDEMVELIRAATMHLRMDRSGAVIETDYDLPVGADPALVEQMDALSSQSGGMTAPYPSEPVGEGARWEAEANVDLSAPDSEGGEEGSMSVGARPTFTLTELDGDHYVIDIEGSMSMEARTVNGMTIDTGQESVHGSLEGSLRYVFPLELTMNSLMDMTMSDGEQTMEVTTAGDVRMTTVVQ